MKEIFIVGELQVSPDNTGLVEEILNTLREKTRSESGCVFYQFFESEGKPGIFATIEHWSNAEAEAAHWQTQHIAEANEKLAPLLMGEMRLSRYQRIGDETGCS